MTSILRNISAAVLFAMLLPTSAMAGSNGTEPIQGHGSARQPVSVQQRIDSRGYAEVDRHTARSAPEGMPVAGKTRADRDDSGSRTDATSDAAHAYRFQHAHQADRSAGRLSDGLK